MITLLMVDDDPDILETVALILEDDTHRVLTALDGRSALEILAAGARPDLVLLDLMMPGMNGWTLRERMLADPELARIPVAVLSGDPRALRDDPPREVVSCVPKPVDVRTLRELVALHADAHASSD